MIRMTQSEWLENYPTQEEIDACILRYKNKGYTYVGYQKIKDVQLWSFGIFKTKMIRLDFKA